ncbi:MAG: hypothetical protein JEY99_10440 [Spirochaetales bacterium]|nr:hypothetical protein [Spirochaetales bacterium]
MKKKLFLILFIFIVSQILCAEERRTRDDFIPPPQDEKSLLDPIPDSLDPRLGLGLSAGVTLSGMALTAVVIHQTLDELMQDPESPAVQSGILKTGGCLVGTAVFAVITDFFLNRVLESRADRSAGR